MGAETAAPANEAGPPASEPGPVEPVVEAEAPVEEPRFVERPVETDETRAKIAAVEAELKAGRVDVDGVLADPRYLPLHGFTGFRAVIRRYARTGGVTMVTADEPGPRCVAHGRVVDAKGRPLAGAELYVYQTDARGWYAAEAPHISVNSGDQQHARLFGYLKLDAEGRYELRTIRPSGYPRTDLPAHIHFEVKGLVTEILFEDDPRLTPEGRVRGEQSGFVVARPVAGADGVTRYEADFVVR